MTSISATSLRMPAIHLPASRQINARATGQAGPPQSASISFARSSTVGVDAVASVSDANLDASTTLLSLSLDLKANQKYSFSFYFPSGGPKVTLVDAAGKAAAVDMSKGFSVKSSGTYTLRFEAGYSLKTTGNFDNLKINAKFVLPTVSGDKRIDALKTQYPDVDLKLIDTSVDYTKGNYEAAISTLFEGATLAVIIVFLFLRDFRATIIAAISLPLSIFPAFWAMDLLGFSLNLVSLLGITLATTDVVTTAAPSPRPSRIARIEVGPREEHVAEGGLRGEPDVIEHLA